MEQPTVEGWVRLSVLFCFPPLGFHRPFSPAPFRLPTPSPFKGTFYVTAHAKHPGNKELLVL